MSYSGLNSIDKTSVLLGAITEKQQVLSANLANMNTPGYVRHDVNFSQLIGNANSPLETQLSKKLGPSPLSMEAGGEVVPAQELVAMQQNMIFYTMATRRVSSVISELKTVVSVGK